MGGKHRKHLVENLYNVFLCYANNIFINIVVGMKENLVNMCSMLRLVGAISKQKGSLAPFIGCFAITYISSNYDSYCMANQIFA